MYGPKKYITIPLFHKCMVVGLRRRRADSAGLRSERAGFSRCGTLVPGTGWIPRSAWRVFNVWTYGPLVMGGLGTSGPWTGRSSNMVLGCSPLFGVFLHLTAKDQAGSYQLPNRRLITPVDLSCLYPNISSRPSKPLLAPGVSPVPPFHGHPAMSCLPRFQPSIAKWTQRCPPRHSHGATSSSSSPASPKQKRHWGGSAMAHVARGAGDRY